ncbi:gluconolactonase [Acetobacter lambici]|uniref:Major royal jelly family protein n=1 Tax=Acetobacter lambici TaxID=1332824 RepID=A0ABT1EXA2_9PROT|nr:L-dopachrome tautomerase-related protein [Acetobacter lambici]MCP1241445.1 major royal jelly family protein [Acetobacter lambici]MCP1257569.1 major royal jelly family protein [Acetobacter lambici]NHO55949.1 gluconolactonase [Acetobacter lambici]
MTVPFFRLSSPGRRTAFGLLAAMLVLSMCNAPSWALHMPKVAELPASALQPFMQSNSQIWDAIVPLPDGRMLLEAPAWVGNTGPQLFVRSTDGQLEPWPNAAWNGTEGDSASRFVALGGLTRTADGHIWVLDSGVTNRKTPPAAPPKLVEIDPATNTVLRVVPIQASALRPGSILSGIAVHGTTAYVPDSGVAGLLVIDTTTATARRFLDHHPDLIASRPIVTPNGPVRDSSGHYAAVDASMVAVSPDGSWIVLQAPGQYLSRVSTAIFNDPDITPAAFEESVTQWFKTPSLGGMTIDNDGTLYWADITTASILSYTTGRVPRRLITDPRLQWPTTPGLDGHGHLYVSASQIDHSTAFGAPTATITWPITIYELTLPTTPPPG